MMKNNLILALVLALLSTFALWYEFKQKPKSEKKEELAKRVVPILEDNEIDTMRLVNVTGGTDFSLQCKSGCKASNYSGEWAITAPGSYVADNVTSSGVANTVANLVPVEKLDVTGADDPILKNYNLHGERRSDRRIELMLKGEKEPVIVYLGDRTAVTSDVYAYVTGPGANVKTVYIVNSALEELLTKRLSHWRSKKVVDVATAEITMLKFTGAKGQTTLTRGQGETAGQWLIDGKNMADPETVDAYVTGLVTMSAQDWVSEDFAKDRPRLDIPSAPQHKLEISIAGKPSVLLHAYENHRKPAEYYLTSNVTKSVAKVDLTSFQKFQKNAESFRLRKLLLPTDKFQAQKLRVAFGKGAPLTINQDKGAWVSADLKDLKASRVDAALNTIGAAKVKAYVSSAEARGEEKATYELLGAGDKLIRSFKFYTRKDKNILRWYARTSAGDYVELEPSTIMPLPVNKDDLTTEPVAPTAPSKMPAVPAGGPPLPVPAVQH